MPASVSTGGILLVTGGFLEGMAWSVLAEYLGVTLQNPKKPLSEEYSAPQESVPRFPLPSLPLIDIIVSAWIPTVFVAAWIPPTKP
jgi:hypothetical protein